MFLLTLCSMFVVSIILDLCDFFFLFKRFVSFQISLFLFLVGSALSLLGKSRGGLRISNHERPASFPLS